MGKRKRSTPCHLNKSQRNEREWDFHGSANLNTGGLSLGLGLSDTLENAPSLASPSTSGYIKNDKEEDLESYSGRAFSLVLNQPSFFRSENIQLRRLGSIPLFVESISQESLSACDQAILSVNHPPELTTLQLENRIFPIKQPVDMQLFASLKNPCLGLQVECTKEVLQPSYEVTVFLLGKAISQELYAERNKDMMVIMGHFFPSLQAPVSRSSHSEPRKQDAEILYCAVKEHHAMFPVIGDCGPPHSSLRPELRPYQQEALRWMLHRENMPVSLMGKEHVLFEEIHPECSQPFYYNKYNGVVLLEKPEAPLLPSGGILADEMGLGKTVEVLALILANPYSQDEEVQNDQCIVSSINTLLGIQCFKSEILDDVDKDNIQHIVSSNCANVEVNKSEHFKGVECEVMVEKAVGENIVERPKNFIDMEVSRIECSTTKVNGLLHLSDVLVEVETSQADTEGIEETKLKPKLNSTCADSKKSALCKTKNGRVAKNKKRKRRATIDSILRTIESVVGGLENVEIKSQPKARSLAREAATKWYNEQLESTRIKKKKDTPSVFQEELIKCLCGELSSSEKIIQCKTCKTWQHCQCVGVNIHPYNFPYYCPQCCQHNALISSGATLVISPTSICNQWVMEVKNHISDPDFSVLVYTGVSKGYVQPRDLAKHHVVFTTYETLRKELNFADLNTNDTLRLRHVKRFMPPPSPLVCLRWWRLCLDEAQMAQCVGSKTSDMARRLCATHRWAITGTPLHNSIEDLHGTVQFLDVEPYTLHDWWRCLVAEPYRRGDPAPLHSLMGQIMWRTAKRDVLDQIKIPLQSEELHWLNFSPTEEFFYRRQHEQSELSFVEGLKRVLHRRSARADPSGSSAVHSPDTSIKLGSLDRQTMNKVLAPLLQLRQACAHPQVVKGNVVAAQGTALTMEELLESLIKKVTTESEDALRQNIAALNGLAGICGILQDWATAVEHYRSALRLWEEYKDKFSVDTLQLIHTFHNLDDALKSNSHLGIPPTLRDSSLKEQSIALETKYMQRHESQLSVAASALAGFTKAVTKLEAEFVHDSDSWWSETLDQLVVLGDEQELLTRLRDNFDDLGVKHNRTRQRILSSSKAMAYELGSWIDGVTGHRKKALKALGALQKTPQDEGMVRQAVDCHIRGNQAQVVNSKRTKCSVCLCENALRSYESELFAMSSEQNQHTLEGDVVLFGKLTRGTWHATTQEAALRVLIAFGRSRHVVESWTEDGNTHMRLLDAAKKEFKRARAVWTQLRDQIAARDELNMCRTRLRLRLPGEIIEKQDELASLHIVDDHNLVRHMNGLKSDKEVAEHSVRRKTGQFGYLNTLRKKSDLESNPDPCPICQANLGDKWSVLQCGHLYCMECVMVLTKARWVKCPICRDVTPAASVSHVNLSRTGEQRYQHDDVALRGSHSAKVQAVVQCLLALRAREKDVKVLIFSTWEKVLNVLQVAFNQNHINVERLKSGASFQTSLQNFKRNAGVTALLLPLHSGSKGLNLTEATHLMFIEPILNPGEELQALGRIHRIGQTKETTVHRFLIRNTIEEQIHLAVKANTDEWQNDQVTLAQLQQLFAPRSTEQQGDRDIVMDQDCEVAEEVEV